MIKLMMPIASLLYIVTTHHTLQLSRCLKEPRCKEHTYEARSDLPPIETVAILPFAEGCKKLVFMFTACNCSSKAGPPHVCRVIYTTYADAINPDALAGAFEVA